MFNNTVIRLIRQATIYIVAFMLMACSEGGGGYPVITLNGPNPQSYAQHQTYIDPGASAVDEIDGDIAVEISGSVDTSTEGSYILTYSATDAEDNTVTVERTVIVEYKPFVTTWKTDNPGSTDANTIKISTNIDMSAKAAYSYTVDWGDGQQDVLVPGNIEHTYSTPGTYTVSISGDFPAIQFGKDDDNQKLISVEQWGSIGWQTMRGAFSGCDSLQLNAADIPILNQVTDMANMFSAAANFNQDISNWDVSNVTDMSLMFYGASRFNQDISGWDVSNVTKMINMFVKAANFDQNLSSWDISSVTDMTGMFFTVGLSVANYDALLIGWADGIPASPQNAVVFGGGGSQYTLGGAAEAARTTLINTYGWSITDGGGI
ncbi:MAG: BspA family leucine-rich repeat surface protein [Gammaproteobacteria bacterium]|nr:BspA family leucine-rich repeat surface protein [Gammaproteobacteria bacterium]